MKATLFGLLALLVALPMSAQEVGYPPANSPYSDLEYKQELTPFGGWVTTSTDAANVLPQSAAIAEIRYQIYLGGPVSFDADFSRMSSSRNVIDPTQIAAKRLSVRRTPPCTARELVAPRPRRKSWHHIVPEVRVGGGIVSSDTKSDSSGYNFGTPFAFTFGGGLKFVSLGRLQLRADVGERLYKQKYPDSFFQAASDKTSVLTTQSRSFWTNQTLLTVGASLLFDR